VKEQGRRIRVRKDFKMQWYNAGFEYGEEGHQPRNGNGLYIPEKARNGILPRACRRNTALPAP
jgi:hypothetical protein